MARTITDEQIKLNIIINGDPAQKQLLDLEKSTKQLTKETEAFKLERKKLEKQGLKENQQWKDLNAIIKQNTNTIDDNKATMVELQRQIGVTGLTMNQLKQRASLLRIQLANAVPNGEAYLSYKKELKQVELRLGELSLKAKTTQFSLSKVADGFNRYAALGASVIAATTGMVLSFQKMIDYNGKLSDAQSDVQKTTGMTKDEVDELTKSFGMLITRTSRIDLLKIAEEGGRIGIVKEEINDFVKVMDKATVALGDSFPGGVEEVASKLGKLKLLFKETKDIGVEKAYESIGSAINELGANGVATEGNIAEFATRLGSLSDALKPSISDALALGAAFEESGITAEIAGRAYSIFLNQAAQETEKFAKVMELSTQEVENMINTNPTQFFLEFSKKLAETSKGGVDTSRTLQDLGLTADGTNKIIGSAGNNFDRFNELLNLSSKSMVQATSLTNEFDVKNNNLAASLDKVSKRLIGIFSSESLKNGLTALVNGFGKLIGAIKDVNDAYIIENEQTFKAATNNRKLADESQKLLERYQSLTKDGVIPTAKEKKELDHITLQLKDRLGESVMAIDKETGSYILNTEAVREQIRLKRLSADEEAMTLVSRKKGVEERKNDLNAELALARKEYELRKEYFEQTNSAQLEAIKNATELGSIPQGDVRQGLAGYKEFSEAQSRLIQIKKDLNIQNEREMDLIQKLKELNFTQKDVNEFFKTTEPKEGETKFMGTTMFTFKGGKWVPEKADVSGNLSGSGNKEDDKLSPEDQKILDSKKKLAEFIAEWEADQKIQKELKKIDEDQRAEQEEILKLEAKYAKMELEANNDTILLASLEEIKQQELAAIRQKYNEIELLENKKQDEKILKQDEEFKRRQIEADSNLEEAKRNVLTAGVNFLGAILSKKSGLYKIIFSLEKAMAISEIITNTTKSVALAWSQEAAIPFILPPGIPNPAKGASLALTSKNVLAAKLNAGVQIATIGSQAIQGLEDGLYPVQREQDGKMFNASFGGNTSSGMVNKPTVFLAGENGPELIVDAKAYKQINPDVKNSFQREIARVKGFEIGLYSQQNRTSIASADAGTSTTDVTVSNTEMIVALNRASAIFEKIERDGILAYMANDLKNGKLIQDTINDYNKLRNKNIR